MLQKNPKLEKGLFPFNETGLSNLLYDKSRKRYTYLGFYGPFEAVPERDLINLKIVHQTNSTDQREIRNFEPKLESGVLILRFSLHDAIADNYCFQVNVVGVGVHIVPAPKTLHSNRTLPAKKARVQPYPVPDILQQTAPQWFAPSHSLVQLSFVDDSSVNTRNQMQQQTQSNDSFSTGSSTCSPLGSWQSAENDLFSDPEFRDLLLHPQSPDMLEDDSHHYSGVSSPLPDAFWSSTLLPEIPNHY